MARIQLLTKLPKQKIERLTTKEDHTYIPTNDPENFNLLKDNRCENEKFSRVDKFRVNHYYLIGTEWLREIIFYPSNKGFEEIDTEHNHPFKKQTEQLVRKGIGLNGERPLPKIEKPVKRMELKCKPSRMALTCKE
jgi:hypothetical protein